MVEFIAVDSLISVVATLLRQIAMNLGLYSFRIYVVMLANLQLLAVRIDTCGELKVRYTATSRAFRVQFALPE